MRAFLALDLGQSWRERSSRLRETVSDSDPGWADEKWVPPGLMHVTLVFLGDIDAGTVVAFEEAASPGIEALSRTELVPSCVCARPNRRRARLLMIDFEPNEPLTKLAADVNTIASELGVEVETRPFLPHQTLVRARRPRQISERALTETTRQVCLQGSVSVPSVTLFESVLGRTGPEYRELRTWILA